MYRLLHLSLIPTIILSRKWGGGERGHLFDTIANGVGAYLGEGTYQSVGAYSRKQ